MDTGRWNWEDEENRGRIRISVGKRVTVKGDRVNWMLDKIKNGRKKNEDKTVEPPVLNTSTTLKFFK
jgi:hypothetical protein